MPKKIPQSYFLGVRITEVMYKKLYLKATSNNVSLSEYVRAIIKKELQEQDRIQERYGYDPAERVLKED